MGASVGVMLTRSEKKAHPCDGNNASTVIMGLENSNNVSTTSSFSNDVRQNDGSQYFCKDLPFQDLNYKFQYVTSNAYVLRAFLRYLFNGMWIIDMFQISSSSAQSSALSTPRSNVSFLDIHCNEIRSELLSTLAKNTIVADSCDQSNWQNFLQSLSIFPAFQSINIRNFRLSKLLTESLHPTIDFLQEHSPHDIDNILIITIALALQVFCRSELFLQLSEQQWSSESIKSAPWQDYARGGRSHIINYYESFSNNKQQSDTPYAFSVFVLLDAFYVRLFLDYSQAQVMSLLLSQKRHGNWTCNLHVCLSALPIQTSIFEMSPNFERQWHGYYNNRSTKFDKCYSLPFDAKRKFSFEITNALNYRLATSTNPTFLAYRNLSNHPEDVVDWQIECLSPVYRCPLITYDANRANFVESFYNANDLNTQSLDTNYGERFDWHINRVVHVNVSLSRDDSSPLYLHRVTQSKDIAFLLSHICG